MKPRSWFRLRSKLDHQTSTSNTDQEATKTQDDVERLRPINFSPNRIATLYVSTSERNLYLAAMSQLDNGPPPLPLWSEPPPTLPPLPPQSTHGHIQASPSDWNTSTINPISPKFVTSPVAAGNGRPGLMIRDEFRPLQPRSAKHALLSLNPPSGMRFTGFPSEALLAVDAVIVEKWPMGLRKRNDSVDGFWAKTKAGEALSWTIELGGTAWTRKGHQELE